MVAVHKSMRVIASGLIATAFAGGFLVSVQFLSDAAVASARAYVAPIYGHAMLDMDMGETGLLIPSGGG